MSLLNLYQEFKQGNITLDEYTTTLNKKPISLKISLTKLVLARRKRRVGAPKNV